MYYNEVATFYTRSTLHNCIITELPSLLPITEVAETLLHMPNGNLLLNRLVANVPDSFQDGKTILAILVTVLTSNGFLESHLCKFSGFICIDTVKNNKPLLAFQVFDS